MPRPVLVLAVALVTGVVAVFVLRHLAYPLLWNDEADTVVFAERILDSGVPDVSGPPSLRYHVRSDHVDAAGIYRGRLLGGYYAAVPAVALARGVEDLRARTARVRLPFALCGLASLVLLTFALSREVGPGSRRRLAFALVYGLCTATSISFLLHLREARYYAPLTLAVVCAVWLVLRRREGSASGVALAAALFAVFNLFYPAFVSLAGWVAIRALVEAARSPGPIPARRARLGHALWPVALAALAVLPVVWSLDLLGLTRGWLDEASGSARSYAENLRFVGAGLVRYELVVPALLARLAVVLDTSRAGPGTRGDGLSTPASLLLLVALHVALVARMPWVWERYLVFASPLVSAALALDLFTLADRARLERRARAGFAVALASTLALLGVRVPDVAAHLEALRVPVEGPLDFVIPHLAARYEDPTRLVIATNYEGPAYTWYLGSHVILGYYGENREPELELVPDVIVPRRWPRNLAALRAMAERVPYERTEFPVAAVRTNQTPSLWRGSPGGVRHAFRTPRPDGPERTFVLERVAGEPAAPAPPRDPP